MPLYYRLTLVVRDLRAIYPYCRLGITSFVTRSASYSNPLSEHLEYK